MLCWLEPAKLVLEDLECEKRVDTLSALGTPSKILKCTEDTSRNPEPAIILGMLVGSSTSLREFKQGRSTSLREFKQVAARRLADEKISS